MPLKSIFSDIFDYGDIKGKKKSPALSEVLPSLISRTGTGKFNVAELNRRAEAARGGRKTRTARTRSASTFTPSPMVSPRQQGSTTSIIRGQDQPGDRPPFYPPAQFPQTIVPGEEETADETVPSTVTNYPAIQSDWEGINEDINAGITDYDSIQSDFEGINKDIEAGIIDSNVTNYPAVQKDWEGINEDIGYDVDPYTGTNLTAPPTDQVGVPVTPTTYEGDPSHPANIPERSDALDQTSADMFGDQMSGQVISNLAATTGLNTLGGLALGGTLGKVLPAATGSAISGLFSPLGLLNIANTGFGTSMAIDEATEAAEKFPIEQQVDVMQGVFQTQPKTLTGQLGGMLGITDPGLTVEDTENLRSDKGYDPSFGRDAESLIQEGMNPDQIFGGQSFETVDMGLNEMDIEGMDRQGIQMDLNQGIREYNEPSFLEKIGFVPPDPETIEKHTIDPVEQGDFSKLEAVSTPEQPKLASGIEAQQAMEAQKAAEAQQAAQQMRDAEIEQQRQQDERQKAVEVARQREAQAEAQRKATEVQRQQEAQAETQRKAAEVQRQQDEAIAQQQRDAAMAAHQKQQEAAAEAKKQQEAAAETKRQQEVQAEQERQAEVSRKEQEKQQQLQQEIDRREQESQQRLASERAAKEAAAKQEAQMESERRAIEKQTAEREAQVESERKAAEAETQRVAAEKEAQVEAERVAAERVKTEERQKITNVESEIANARATVEKARQRAANMSEKMRDNQGNPMHSRSVKAAQAKIRELQDKLAKLEGYKSHHDKQKSLGVYDYHGGYSYSQRTGRESGGGWSDYSGDRGTRGGFGDVSKGGYGGMGGI